VWKLHRSYARTGVWDHVVSETDTQADQAGDVDRCVSVNPQVLASGGLGTR